MLKAWLKKIFCKKRTSLENIVIELREINEHLRNWEESRMMKNI